MKTTLEIPDDLFRRTKATASLRGESLIGEYRYGLLGPRHRGHLQRLLVTLIRESIVLPVDETTAETYSEVRDGLRRDGRPIPENDLWIASLARQHRQPVVSRDSHFDYVSDIRRVAW